MIAALPAEYRDLLAGLPASVEARWYSGIDGACKAVSEAEVLWTGHLKPGEIRAAVEVGPGLRWAHTHGAGTENHPLDLYRARGITFTNGSGIGAVPISEYVVTMMLAAAKD